MRLCASVGRVRPASYPRVMSTATIARDPETEVFPLSRELYDQMVEAGKFEGQHVELLEGVLVRMAPQGDEHWRTTHLLGCEIAYELRRRFGRKYSVGQQGPIAASDSSEPEPDVVVIDMTTKPHGHHPTCSPLIIEVAMTSQVKDLQHKPLIYARADVLEYWVIDLVARRTVVHRRPTVDGYVQIDAHPFDATLEVLGIPIRIADLIG